MAWKALAQERACSKADTLKKNLEKQGFGHFVTFGPQLAFEVHQQKKPWKLWNKRYLPPKVEEWDQLARKL